MKILKGEEMEERYSIDIVGDKAYVNAIGGLYDSNAACKDCDFIGTYDECMKFIEKRVEIKIVYEPC